MTEYIDKATVLSLPVRHGSSPSGWEDYIRVDDVKAIPTADVVPVRHGRWIKGQYWSEGVGMGESYGYWYSCSECGRKVKGDYGRCRDNFCWNCGADMRKDGDGDV